MSDIKPQFKGNIGIFLTCAELSKRNLIAMPTSRNTKGYDVMVMNPETNKAVGIQVKCTDKRDFPILSSYWRDYDEKIEEKIMSNCIFVDISDLSKPNYFIVAHEELKNLLKSLFQKYARDFGKRHGLSWQDILAREKSEKRKPNLWAIKLSDIAAYKDRWETITNKLGSLGH